MASLHSPHFVLLLSPMDRITTADIEAMRSHGCDRSIIAEAEAWLRLSRRAEELIDIVTDAFQGVTLGNGIGLRESDGIDDYAGADQLRALRESDEKFDWQKIPADLLNRCNAAPSFLDAEGLRFHLPAFLVAELRGGSHDIIDRLIYRCFADTGFIELLTPQQRHAIIACISFYGAIEQYSYDPKDIQDAILRYAHPSRDRKSI